jgi:hypothetical protein
MESLKLEIDDLRSRLQSLEQRLIELTSDQAITDTVVSPVENLHVTEADEAPAGDAEAIALGGALRFNVAYRDDVDDSVGKRGESGLEVFRLNVDGRLDDFLVSAEYRFYPYMSTIRHGWVGYEFDDESQLQVGISRVPFGLLPYAAHNFWFGVPYYVGLADDHDMGIKYQREDGPWRSELAFYKNEELNDASNLDRYAYDLVRVGEQQNEEVNQFNARLAYLFGLDSGCETELGLSLQTGEVYNRASKERGDQRAYGLHLDRRCGRWNLQLQHASYRYDLANPPEVAGTTVLVGALAGSYEIDADADIWVANVAYNLPSPWERVDSITCYNDYSRLNKSLADSEDSQINTLGCAIGSGPIYTYIDYILARNMPFFGDGSLAAGGDDDWQARFNINIGYYW